MTAENERLLIYAGAAALGVLVFMPELFGKLLGSAAIGAGKVVVTTAEGVVIGLGESVGIPQTNAALCEQAIAEGRKFDASKYCPAGTYIKTAAGWVYDWFGDLVGVAPPTAEASIIRIEPAQAAAPTSADTFQAWYAATGGVLRPGQTQEQAIDEWLGRVTPINAAVDIWEGIPQASDYGYDMPGVTWDTSA